VTRVWDGWEYMIREYITRV